jgi:replication-associated recombination protein RarA
MDINDILRPKTLDEMAGHTKQRAQLNKFKEQMGWDGKAFWIVGPSGSGKTTIARIIAETVADPYAICEIDAIDCTLELLRDWERLGHCKPLFGPGHAFIINEAHNLSSKCVSRFQTLLESGCRRHSTWIFTTTDAGQMRLFDGKFDGFPFLSRCLQVYLELDADTKQDFARYLRDVAVKMEWGPDDLEPYTELLTAFGGNMRMALNQLSMGCLV